ncbi:MAG TPA: arginine deiminase-related protein [Wenzhouxiangella sp.]|nr:arginine deiminase-related protein [Wenzhouxiangella sp.]
MIVRTPSDFRKQISAGGFDARSPAAPRGVFLVEPASFSLAEQSASDNKYMNLDVEVDHQRAVEQHRALTEAIAACGIPVVRFPGRAETPDDIYPNNVFATAAGKFIVGAMYHPVRQREAGRADIRAFFTKLLGYETVDLSGRDLVAELTGVLIVDRARRIGYCGMTNRVDDAGCQAMHEAFDLALTFQFDLAANEYHTNIAMSVLSSRALVICPEAFADPEVPAAIGAAFPDRTLELSRAEKEAFAGNIIALSDRDLFISQTAVDALVPEKLDRLREWDFEIHAVELDEIEKAGGSLRCCVAEIY